jgi:hypothetical protein
MGLVVSPQGGSGSHALDCRATCLRVQEKSSSGRMWERTQVHRRGCSKAACYPAAKTFDRLIYRHRVIIELYFALLS